MSERVYELLVEALAFDFSDPEQAAQAERCVKEAKEHLDFLRAKDPAKPMTCKEIHAEETLTWHENYARSRRLLKAALAREFPIGCKVQFKHGKSTIQCVVKEHCAFSDKVILVNTKTKAQWEKSAWELELDKEETA